MWEKQKLIGTDYSLSGAFFDVTRNYRYTLWRRFESLPFEGRHRLIAFIGLNPSIADEHKDDNTIRRCIGFAKRWSYSGLVMLNLFAWRSPYPAAMKSQQQPVEYEVGENNRVIRAVLSHVSGIVCCWGVDGSYRDRGTEMLRLLQEYPQLCVYCLGTNTDGSPKHPLFLPGDAEREPLYAFCEGGPEQGRVLSGGILSNQYVQFPEKQEPALKGFAPGAQMPPSRIVEYQQQIERVGTDFRCTFRFVGVR